MLLIILRVAYLLVCAGAILAYINPETVHGAPLPIIIHDHRLVAFFVLLFLSQIVTVGDMLISKNLKTTQQRIKQ